MENITKELLEPYAKVSNSYYEILIRMQDDGHTIDLEDKLLLRRLIYKINKYEIDIKHMKYNGVAYKHVIWCLPEAVFKDYVKESRNYSDLINKIKDKYKVSLTFPPIKNRIKLESIDTSHMIHNNSIYNKKIYKNISDLTPLKCTKCHEPFPKKHAREQRKLCPKCKKDSLGKLINWNTITIGELKIKYENNKHMHIFNRIKC